MDQRKIQVFRSDMKTPRYPNPKRANLRYKFARMLETKYGVSRHWANLSIEAFSKFLSDELCEKGIVRLNGFGMFRVKVHKSHLAKNGLATKVTFKPSKLIKQAIKKHHEHN